MIGTGRIPPQDVPTLTEVLSLPEATESGVAEPAPQPPDDPQRSTEPQQLQRPIEPQPQSTAAGPPATALPSEREIADRLLVDLQRQLDLALEIRLREALAPALSRATDALVRDAKKELTAVLRDAVDRAVAAELAKRR